VSEQELLVVADVAAWRAWLDANEDQSDGVWLLLAKKGTTSPTSLRYDEALDEALCSGWIDGQVKSVDAATYRQRFTPRRARSIWSQRNVGHIARLTKERRMRPRGKAEVKKAKADGRWERAYAGSATIEVPDDLTAALAKHPKARETFESLSAANRFAILFQLTTAVRPETRQRRLEAFVAKLKNGHRQF
jgi:uncharacterized protein YdeI (YjbR/CyaY-like superfamily)